MQEKPVVTPAPPPVRMGDYEVKEGERIPRFDDECRLLSRWLRQLPK